jgi:phenylalanyl-tRNA synthetase beta chain
MRPINNLVDITNCVMLEYGQPMHAFDFSCVKNGEIHIRCAHEGESIRTLDGTERKLTTSMLCICDTERPVAVAGVMGGENSEIVGDTAMVLFESACFNGPSVRRTATALGMRTDASSRFEKGLDAEGTVRAVQRACELVELLGCGEVVGGRVDVHGELPQRKRIAFEPERINAYLGTDISKDTMLSYFKRLEVEYDASSNELVIPTFRQDLLGFADSSEEVARIYGYDKIPTTLPRDTAQSGGMPFKLMVEKLARDTAISLGITLFLYFSHIPISSFLGLFLFPHDFSMCIKTLKFIVYFRPIVGTISSIKFSAC